MCKELAANLAKYAVEQGWAYKDNSGYARWKYRGVSSNNYRLEDAHCFACELIDIDLYSQPNDLLVKFSRDAGTLPIYIVICRQGI